MTNKSAYQPEGYQSVIPYLHVNGAAQLIAFMKEAFDAKEIAVYPRPEALLGMRRSGSAIRSSNWQM